MINSRYMRLVREDEDTGMPENDSPIAVDAAEAFTPAQPLDNPEDTTTDDQTIPAAEVSETPDGAVMEDPAAADALADADDAAGDSSADVQIDPRALEALLLGTHHPLTAGRLAELLDLKVTRPIKRAIQALNQQYAESGRSFRIEQVAGGFQILTLPEYGPCLQKLHQKEADARLTRAALETLAIIAYKQPILRADVEAIRGVASGETIRSLMEKHLVKIAGRAEIPGRPILYGTTKRFLEVFGLNSLKDLPQDESQLKATRTA